MQEPLQTFSGWLRESEPANSSLHNSISIVLIPQFTLEQWKYYCVNFSSDSLNQPEKVCTETTVDFQLLESEKWIPHAEFKKKDHFRLD